MKRKQKELPKQRNPYVEHMRFKVCGAHGKSKKVQQCLVQFESYHNGDVNAS